MALTQWQQDLARFDGGKDLTNRKRHLAQVKSALLTLCTEIESGINPAGMTATEAKTLREAARLVAGVESAYAKDAAEAKRIQSDWEARHKLAMKTLLTLPHEAPEDVIALAALSGDLQPAYLLRDCVKWGWQSKVRDLQREAISTLAHRCANQATPPHKWCKDLAAQMPTAKTKHAALIAQVNALAVQDRLQRAAA